MEVFFRDDDAGWEDDRLFAMLETFAAHELPIDLAVIPDETNSSLATELLRRAASQPIGFHQHGRSHHNHEPEGAKKWEFGPARDLDTQHADLAAGREHLLELFGPDAVRIFVPPWNRCTLDTMAALTDLGFVGLSRDSGATPEVTAPLVEVPVTFDWYATKKKVPLPRPAVGELLAWSIEHDAVVGVMLHHNVTDADERREIDRLLDVLAAHPRVRAHRMVDSLL